MFIVCHQLAVWHWMLVRVDLGLSAKVWNQPVFFWKRPYHVSSSTLIPGRETDNGPVYNPRLLAYPQSSPGVGASLQRSFTQVSPGAWNAHMIWNIEPYWGIHAWSLHENIGKLDGHGFTSRLVTKPSLKYSGQWNSGLKRKWQFLRILKTNAISWFFLPCSVAKCFKNCAGLGDFSELRQQNWKTRFLSNKLTWLPCGPLTLRW